jgi:hypothetical protein
MQTTLRILLLLSRASIPAAKKGAADTVAKFAVKRQPLKVSDRKWP